MEAGGATPLAFLLGTLAMLAVGGTVAMFARSLSSAGSMYTYITRGANRTLGFLGGWCYAAAFLVLGGAVLWGFGFFTASLVALITGGDPGWYWFSAAGLVVIAVMSIARPATAPAPAAIAGRCQSPAARSRRAAR